MGRLLGSTNPSLRGGFSYQFFSCSDHSHGLSGQRNSLRIVDESVRDCQPPILGAPTCDGGKTKVSGQLLDDPGEGGFQSAGARCSEARAPLSRWFSALVNQLYRIPYNYMVANSGSAPVLEYNLWNTQADTVINVVRSGSTSFKTVRIRADQGFRQE